MDLTGFPDMPADVLWEKTLSILETKINRFAFELYIKRLNPISFEDNVFCLEAPATLEMGAFDDSRALIEDAISAIAEKKATIEVRQAEPASNPARLAPFRIAQPAPKAAKPPAAPPPQAAPPAANKPRYFLNPRYTFENFIVGPKNRLCHATALTCAKSPGTAYNPLFIYGSVGVGKTHLMQAAGHYIAQNRPDFNIMYMATDTFINEFAISSIANKRLDFHARFKNVDLLLMDDIQFLKYKDATQKEFFSIFNNLQQAQKQIIITCDRLPREIPGIEEGLRNRFGCGLIADIQPPNYETRLAILQSKMKQGSVELPLNFLEMIASRITTNIRDLEGALNRICACVSLSDIEANEELVMKTINEIAPPAAYAAPSISQIIDAVCSHFNIDPESVAGGQRSHEIVLPRRIAMRLCKELTNQTLSVIGKSFGKKHATVIYSLKKLDEEMREDPNIAKTFRTIRNNLMPPV